MFHNLNNQRNLKAVRYHLLTCKLEKIIKQENTQMLVIGNQHTQALLMS